MTTKLMVCQLRKGDVILGKNGGRWVVQEAVLEQEEVRLVTDKLVAMLPWFASVVVEMGDGQL